MRKINHFTEKPETYEIARVAEGKRAWIYIRTDIESHTVTDEDGENRTEWSAIEYSTQMNVSDDFKVTKALADKLIAAETENAAKVVRDKRNQLLEGSDNEMLVDRADPESEHYQAVKAYRQVLRDIPSQPGFPFDVEWPEKPQA